MYKLKTFDIYLYHNYNIIIERHLTVIDDPDHSEQEDRFIILGQSNQAKLLVVCHCYRESDTVIRIISAKKATKTESSQYYDF